MAMFGKALGNGLQLRQSSALFCDASCSSHLYSSTFWTERVGPAALKTLEIMEREKSWDKITQTGKMLEALANWLLTTIYQSH